LNHHAARRLKIRVRLNSFESVARMVESGVGLAVLPESVARRYRRSMAIQIVPLSDGWTTRHFTVCTHRSRSLPPHAKRLLEYLIRHSPSAG
jgi:DNA-binding transcriptional LysR family regulator